ncbi:MAG TPA: dihydrolipoamide acetyltransferase family protein [Armatimonadota bacterium]
MAEMPMPKMGDAMEEGTIVQWLKAEGDPVKEEEPLAEIETEKSTVQIVSFETGILSRILVKEGETVPVGAPIALIQAEGETTAPAEPAEAPAAAKAPAAKVPAAVAAGSASTAPPPVVERHQPEVRAQNPVQERLRVSPLARRLAEEGGVDLARIAGTGPSGRILEADIREHLKAAPEPAVPAPHPAPAPAPVGPPAAGDDDREMSRIRKVIARRMTESKQTVPHFYITVDVDMKEALALRKRLNEREGGTPITITDMILKACAAALARVPAANASALGDKVRFHSRINLGLAVAIDQGLVVPVLNDCQSKSLTQIAADTRPLVQRAREGKLQPQEMTGATFTISNLGMFDVDSFVAIVNPPEAAILAVGSIEERPVAKDGVVVVSPRMKMTLSADHRVLDGAVAAQFTQQLKRLLQTPLDLLE